jgi:D-serine deaminase-like pyridoxal phosphate-dependent protein
MDRYTHYSRKLVGLPYPYAVVDMELLRTNIDRIVERAGGLPVRLATKSIRCPYLIEYILNYHSTFRGLMCYDGREADYLLGIGMDDMLMGYPLVEPEVIGKLAEWSRKGRDILFMVDSPAHVDLLNDIAQKYDTTLSVCIEIDLSDRYPGLHFGVHRSPIRSVAQFEQMVGHTRQLRYIRIAGLMGYEAQVAGVGDAMPGKWLQNRAVHWLQQRAIRRAAARRWEAVRKLQELGFEKLLVNGGGTGSLESTRRDSAVTELTAGSGFLGGTLFDGYRQFAVEPALFYGIPVVRHPAPDVYTCHGGGYTASGTVEATKGPEVYLPVGGRLDPNEGAGEVQTPVRFSPDPNLSLGDPVYLRYAKAGELLDRFGAVHLLEGDELHTVPTYRGVIGS